MSDRSVESYRAEGFQYLVVSSEMYNRYMVEAVRYPNEVSFYREVFAQGRLVAEFTPSRNQDGLVVRVYKLSATSS